MYGFIPLLMLHASLLSAGAAAQSVTGGNIIRSGLWHLDYQAARQAARERNVPLFVVFR